MRTVFTNLETLKKKEKKFIVLEFTSCCGASLKGSMGVVVCRACYEEMDETIYDDVIGFLKCLKTAKLRRKFFKALVNYAWSI